MELQVVSWDKARSLVREVKRQIFMRCIGYEGVCGGGSAAGVLL